MSVYIFHILIMTGIFAILALSLNILAGFAGLVSLGHAAFFGIGAYLSSLLMINGLGFIPAFLLSGGITSILGLTLAMPALRVKDDYLAIVTLGFGIIMGLVFLNLEITGGPDGLTGIPPVRLLGKPLYSKPGFLGLVSGILAPGCSRTHA
jgi:branched-chain amino acid transport system permease protein